MMFRRFGYRRYFAAYRTVAIVPLMIGWCMGVAGIACSPKLLPLWLPLLALPVCILAARPWNFLLAGSMLGAFWALVCASRLLAQWLPPDCERLPLTVRGHVASVPEKSRLSGDRIVQRFLLDISDIQPGRCAGPGRVRLSYYGNENLAPGQRGTFLVLLRVPWSLANPGGGYREAWYGVNGVHAVGSVRRLTMDHTPLPLRYVHHSARAMLQQSMDALNGSERSKGLLAALTIGARERIGPDDWRLLRDLGVVHLVVISGLHVSLVGAVGALLGGMLSRLAPMFWPGTFWRQLPLILSFCSAALYAALAGFSLPTVRALIMLSGLLLALSIGRQAAGVGTLLVAVAILLLVQPLAPFSSGFWLSIGAVSALLWLSAWHAHRHYLATALRVHLYLCVALLPLTAWWFAGGSLIAPLANAVAVPVVSTLVVPLTLLASVLSLLWPFAADACWMAALRLLDCLLALADAASIHAGYWAYRQLGGGAYAALNALLGIGALGIPLPLLLKACALGLLLPLLLQQPLPVRGEGMELAVLDVGQGTSVVVSDGERALVYDTGGGEPGAYTAAAAAVIPYLRHRGATALDTLVISHADRDHSAGVQALFEALPVERFLYSQPLENVPDGSRCRTGAAWSWANGIRFQVLAGAEHAGLSANDGSCVLLVDMGGHRFLLPGDINAARERELLLYWREALQADWLLAAHHGSGGSTGTAWLRAVSPEGVVLNHGRANAYGHPHPAVLRRLEERDLEIHATARDGAVIFRVTPDGELAVRTARGAYRPFWLPPG